MILDEKPATSRVSWLDIREKVVEQAITDGDYDALRRISTLPGGFGSEAMRRRVWPVLLQVDRWCSPDNEDLEGRAIHKDEGQVELDTNRSFVIYPTGIDSGQKKAMKNDLQSLIVGVLRTNPVLSYFQGYHDILSVFYLTFIPPPSPILPGLRNHSRSSSRQSRRGQIMVERKEAEDDEKASIMPHGMNERSSPEWKTLRGCAEAVSVFRVRDAMGSGMEGMMGMLRILKRILKAADPELSRFSAQISPVPTLPFFALSWILCLFSHDIDTLEPVQRMFDYLLARNPVSAIYLAVAILIAKKPQMLQLAKNLGPDAQDDPSLLHPLFSRLPPLYPDTPDQPVPPTTQNPSKARGDENDDPNPYSPIVLSEVFQLADKLMLEHPWDGSEIRGGEIMGEGSVVYSYEREMATLSKDVEGSRENEFSLAKALELVDQHVVRPGIGMDDSEAEEEVSRPVKKRVRRRRTWYTRLQGNKAGTTIAVGVVLLGVGMAVFGIRAGGMHSSWAGWWAVVIGRWVGKDDLGVRLTEITKVAGEMKGVLVRSIRGLL